jgi:hypothetical protein
MGNISSIVGSEAPGRQPRDGRFLQCCGRHGIDAPSSALREPRLGRVPEGSSIVLPDHAHSVPKSTLADIRACLVGTRSKNPAAGAPDHWELILPRSLQQVWKKYLGNNRPVISYEQWWWQEDGWHRGGSRAIFEQEQRGRRKPKEGQPAFKHRLLVS